MSRIFIGTSGWSYASWRLTDLAGSLGQWAECALDRNELLTRRWISAKTVLDCKEKAKADDKTKTAETDAGST
jgi:hypothetical protein